MSVLSSNKKIAIKWAISIIAALLPLFFPLGDIYTVQLQYFLIFTILGIFLMAFELINGFAVSMIVVLGWCISGAATFAQSMSAWSSSSLYMTIGAMIFINALSNTGLLNRLGYWCIVKTGGTFKGLVWGLYFAGLIMIIVGFSMDQVLVFAFAYTLYKALDLKPTDRESIVIVWTTAIAGVFSITFVYSPVSVSLMSSAVQAVIPNFSIKRYDFTLYNALLFLVALFLVWLGIKWYELGTSENNIDAMKGKQYFINEYEKLGNISKDEKKGIMILVVLVLFLITQTIHQLDAAYLFLGANVLSFFPGVNLADTKCIKDIPWDNVFVVGLFLGMGTIASTMGLSEIIAQMCIPLISQLGHYWGHLGTAILAVLVNFVLSPFAMVAVLPAPIISYCQALGFNPMAHLTTMYVAKEIVFLPYEYPAYLILYAFGMVDMGNMIKICSIKSIFILLSIAFILIPYWYLIGLT